MKPCTLRTEETAPQTRPLIDPTPFRLEEGDDIVGLLRQLVNGDHPGVLATMDRDGLPRMRWMASLSFEFFPYLYTLTSPSSRKVDQLKQHREVSWMFFNADLTLVVNLFGHAEVIEDEKTIQEVWKHVRDKEHSYFLRNCIEGPGCAVIRTTIERVECTTPQNYMHFDVPRDSLLNRGWRAPFRSIPPT
ncbi:MAG TPA: pyridoxamine 5'-phosphate oxidase family protein [Candidatus Methylacidiphilales bacterium]